jgi:TPR repeat protein
MLPSGETDVQASLSNKTVRVLGSEEIKLLTRQGEQFAEAGDLVTARVLLQRAAEADDATAATALGATYDPTVIAKLGVVGIGADVEKARFWYRKAASLGSTDAKRRLDLLANR